MSGVWANIPKVDAYLLRCHHCHKIICNCFVGGVVAFCDDCCYNSALCEETAESKDEMLQAISYANNREGLRNELEEVE